MAREERQDAYAEYTLPTGDVVHALPGDYVRFDVTVVGGPEVPTEVVRAADYVEPKKPAAKKPAPKKAAAKKKK
jgi:hypothetical protein